MELLFVTLGGMILGLIAQYGVPSRPTRGALLLPAVGAVVAAIVWACLTWAGLKFSGGWIWVISLVVAGTLSVLVGIVARRRRLRSDDEALRSLGGKAVLSRSAN